MYAVVRASQVSALSGNEIIRSPSPDRYWTTVLIEDVTHTLPFCKIGSGRYNDIWLAPEGTWVLKCDDPTRRAATSSLTVISEFHRYLDFEESLERLRRYTHRFFHFNLPTAQKLVKRFDHQWWSANQARLSPIQPRCNALVLQRIPSFDRRVRERLATAFFPDMQRPTVLLDDEANECLIRPYLGRRSSDYPPRYDSLADMPFYVDEMRRYGLPIEAYARAMADALAMMLWSAETNAARVDFVLAPEPHARGMDGLWCGMLGSHSMWLFDLDEVKFMDLDDLDCPEVAADAFFDNGGFYPDPAAVDEEDRELWDIFQRRFRTTSAFILGVDCPLPQVFIDQVEQRARNSASFRDLLLFVRH